MDKQAACQYPNILFDFIGRLRSSSDIRTIKWFQELEKRYSIRISDDKDVLQAIGHKVFNETMELCELV